MSITSAMAVSILGWGVMSRHLFNPLRELTADLRERAHRQELIAEISRRATIFSPLDELLCRQPPSSAPPSTTLPSVSSWRRAKTWSCVPPRWSSSRPNQRGSG